MTFKHFKYNKNEKKTHTSKPEVTEIELKVESLDKAKTFIEAMGLVAYRAQEKRRHSYKLDGVKIDIDSWPKIPPYAEIEGDSEEEIRNIAEKLGFNWYDAVFRGAGYIIDSYLKTNMQDFRNFTFSKVG